MIHCCAVFQMLFLGLFIGWSGKVELLPILLHDVLQMVVEGILAKQFPALVARPGRDVLQFLRNDHPDAFLLQCRVNRPDGFRRGIVNIVHRGRIEAEPSQGRLGGIRQLQDFIRELLAIRVIQAVRKAVDDQARRSQRIRRLIGG